MRSFARSSACFSGRVMTTPLPKSGLESNHCKVARRATTSPTTRIAGGANLHSLARVAILASVPVRISCLGVVPQRISAAGVFGDRPLSFNSFTIFSIFFTPIRKTRVPMRDKACQSISLFSLVGSSCPVTKATVEVNPLCVSGMPA